jgi:hypothetical protein
MRPIVEEMSICASVAGMSEAERYRSLRSLCFHVGHAKDYTFTKRPRRGSDRIQGHGYIPGIEQPIQLRPARVKLLRHRLLSLLLFLHGLFQLPRKHPLGGDRLDFLLVGASGFEPEASCAQG